LRLNNKSAIMRKSITSWVCVLFLAYINGCGSPVGQPASDKISMETHQEEVFRMEDFFSEIKVIPLETTNECLLTRIRQVEVVDSLVFISDNNHQLYVFNLDGHFLRQIGIQGQGPKEYRTFNAFYVNRSSRTVTLVDHTQRALLTYLFDGSFVSSESIPDRRIAWEDYAQLAGDGNVLLSNAMNPEHDRAYTLLDPSKKDTLPLPFTYRPIRLKGYSYNFAAHPMSVTDGNIYFTMPLDSVIYEYSDGKISPRYTLEVPREMISKKSMGEAVAAPDTKSYPSELMRLCGKNSFAGFTNIFATNKYFWLDCAPTFRGEEICVLDREKEVVHYYRNNISLSDKLLHPYTDIMASFDNGLVGVFTNTFSINYFKSMMENPEAFGVTGVHPAVKEALAAADDEDNHILVFYYLK